MWKSSKNYIGECTVQLIIDIVITIDKSIVIFFSLYYLLVCKQE